MINFISELSELRARIDAEKTKLNRSIEKSNFSLADEQVQLLSCKIEQLLTELYGSEKKLRDEAVNL